MYDLRIVRRAAFAVACLTLSSCALVDTYSDRATVYNLEAEQAQEKAILLNIIRGSLRRPMQFTTVTSIIGTASASGTGGYAAPVNVPFRSSGGSGSYPALDTWTASASLSGGETFTVPVLDTQEFYQGILKPIPLQYYDLLLQQRYPPDLLFNLFIQKVVMRADVKPDGTTCKGDHTELCEYVFKNYVSNSRDVVAFQMLAHYLLRAGLTTEPTNKADEKLLPKPSMNINLKLFGGTGQTGASGQSSGGTASGGSQSGEPLSKDYKFCFAPKNENYKISSNCDGGTGDKMSPGADSLKITVGPLARTLNEVKGAPECNAPHNDPDNDPYTKFCGVMKTFLKSTKITFEFYPKSTQAVIFYLGEVVRRQLYPDPFDPIPFALLINTGIEHLSFPGPPELAECVQPPVQAPVGNCSYLFRIENSPLPLPDTVWVAYSGAGYVLSDYNHHGGFTMSSLEIVKQLLALFSSAKSLPSTTVLSVVNQ